MLTKCNNFLKSINKKDLFFVLAIVLFQVSIYYITKPFLREASVLSCVLDDNIPFIPYFIWFYVSWYPLLVLVPYYISTKSKVAFFKYSTVCIISMIITAIIFVVCPKTVVRGVISDSSISSKLVELIYYLDTPGLNCLPSIHCILCFLFMFGTLSCKEKMPMGSKIAICTISVLIVLSTLFVKQHVVCDALLALLIVSVVWFITCKLNLHKIFETKIYDKVTKIK